MAMRSCHRLRKWCISKVFMNCLISKASKLIMNLEESESIYEVGLQMPEQRYKTDCELARKILFMDLLQLERIAYTSFLRNQWEFAINQWPRRTKRIPNVKISLSSRVSVLTLRRLGKLSLTVLKLLILFGFCHFCTRESSLARWLKYLILDLTNLSVSSRCYLHKRSHLVRVA